MSDTAESAGALGTLFFYVMFVHPVCAWILAPKRFPKDRAIVYAIAFLATIAIGKMALENAERGPNFYQLLGVRRGSSAIEIKRAYRQLSLELHPDKNPSQDAADMFSKIQAAQEILMDSEKREIYDKLGPEAATSKHPFNENTMLIEMAIWYITWGVLAYVMTLGKANRQARDWVFTGQIVMLAVEVAIVTTPGGDGVLPSWLFPHMAEYEVVWILHSIFPAYMNGCRSLGSHLFVDVDQQTRDMLLALRAGHQDVLVVLRDIQGSINSLGSSGGGARLTNSSSGGSAGPRAIPARASAVGKLRELEEKLTRNGTGVDAVAAEIKDSGKSSGNMQWLLVGVWVVFYFFVNNGGS
ncbi:unnamed protein product [Ectocarpus sp. 6 AP-2014]